MPTQDNTSNQTSSPGLTDQTAVTNITGPDPAAISPAPDTAIQPQTDPTPAPASDTTSAPLDLGTPPETGLAEERPNISVVETQNNEPGTPLQTSTPLSSTDDIPPAPPMSAVNPVVSSMDSVNQVDTMGQLPPTITPDMANGESPKNGVPKVVGILGVLLLVLGVGTGVVLVGRNQLFNQEASPAEGWHQCQENDPGPCASCLITNSPSPSLVEFRCEVRCPGGDPSQCPAEPQNPIPVHHGYDRCSNAINEPCLAPDAQGNGGSPDWIGGGEMTGPQDFQIDKGEEFPYRAEFPDPGCGRVQVDVAVTGISDPAGGIWVSPNGSCQGPIPTPPAQCPSTIDGQFRSSSINNGQWFSAGSVITNTNPGRPFQLDARCWDSTDPNSGSIIDDASIRLKRSYDGINYPEFIAQQESGGTLTNVTIPAETPAVWYRLKCQIEGVNPACENYDYFNFSQTGGPTPSPTVTSSPSATPTPTATPIPGVAQCLGVKAYKVTGVPSDYRNWQYLTSDDLRRLKAGDTVYFTISGAINQGDGAFDKGQLRINGVTRPETTNLKPQDPRRDIIIALNEYYDIYQIPANTVSFNVLGRIHHTTLGWIGDIGVIEQ